MARASISSSCLRQIHGNSPGRCALLLPLGTELHVVEHREQAQGLGQLEGAHLAHAGDSERRDPGQGPALEFPGPGVRLVEAGQKVEQGGLAGAVGADEGRDRAARDLEVVDVDGDEAAERAAHIVGDEDRVDLGDTGCGVTLVQAGRLGPAEWWLHFVT